MVFDKNGGQFVVNLFGCKGAPKLDSDFTKVRGRVVDRITVVRRQTRKTKLFALGRPEAHPICDGGCCFGAVVFREVGCCCKFFRSFLGGG